MPREIKAISRRDYHRQLEVYATARFSQHDYVVARGDRHWTISRSGYQPYWADVVILSNGGVVVWGDVELVCFAYGPRGEPLDCLAWMADSEFEYAAGKANIGSGMSLTRRSHEVALAELKDLRSSSSDPTELTAINIAIAMVRREEPFEDIDRHLFDANVDLPNVGHVIDSRVAMALAACRRLYHLLTKPKENHV